MDGRLAGLAAEVAARIGGEVAGVRELEPSERAEVAAAVPADAPIEMGDLVAIDVRFVRPAGDDGFGRLVCVLPVAEEIAAFFCENHARPDPWPLTSVIPLHLIARDAVDEDPDEISMAANNCYAFAARRIRDTDRWSRHLTGAIDLNPLFNPVVTADGIRPAGAARWAEGREVATDRRVIREGSWVLDWFRRRGWTWGGDWQSLKDYHHFEPGGE